MYYILFVVVKIFSTFILLKKEPKPELASQLKMAQPFTITLKPEIKSIVRFEFIFQGLMILLSAALPIHPGFTMARDISLLSVLTFVSAIFFFFLAKKYLNAVFLEKISVTYGTLTVIHKT